MPAAGGEDGKRDNPCMTHEESLTYVTDAIAVWVALDRELDGVQKLAIAAARSGSLPAVITGLAANLAEIRANRERAYRAALAAMQVHHDRDEA
jgi:hypothetical protein